MFKIFTLLSLLFLVPVPTLQVELYKKLSRNKELPSLGYYRKGDTVTYKLPMELNDFSQGLSNDTFKNPFAWDYDQLIIHHIFKYSGQQLIGPFTFHLDSITVKTDSILVQVLPYAQFSPAEKFHITLFKRAKYNYVIVIEQLLENLPFEQIIQLKDYNNKKGLSWQRMERSTSDNALYKIGKTNTKAKFITHKYAYRLMDTLSEVLITKNDFIHLPKGATVNPLRLD